VASVASILFTDGSTCDFKYRLPALARYLKYKRTIKQYKELKKAPIFPWILEMALADAHNTAGGRVIASITIKEKVI
jgi:hypothetical protein